MKAATALFLLALPYRLAVAEAAPDVAPYVITAAPLIALTHLTVIDGTGAAALTDQTLLIDHGRIARLGAAATVSIPAGAEVHELRGHAVLPGLIGMHDHLYYTAAYTPMRRPGRIEEPGLYVQELPFSAPRLYLAAGVTTARTTGSVEPYTDLKVRERIAAGLMPGPALDLSAPYLEGPGTPFAQMHELKSPAEAAHFVDTWAEAGMTSLKAYMHITRAQLSAAIGAAHRHHLKLTAHLCSVSWPEAIAAGIDDFEHGPVYTDSQFVPERQPDVCPSRKQAADSWLKQDLAGAEVAALIHSLVSHHVAVTSTLPVFEAGLIGRPPLRERTLQLLSPDARDSYLTARAQIDPHDAVGPELFRREMAFERAFYEAGGLLLAGPDPTGNGGVLPGLGDQREVELLVEAGLTPLEAIKVATLNGARYLGREGEIGSLAAGKHADLIVVRGDPSARIEDLENVEIVFRDGIGYDSPKLIDAVRGQVGIR